MSLVDYANSFGTKSRKSPASISLVQSSDVEGSSVKRFLSAAEHLPRFQIGILDICWNLVISKLLKDSF